MAETPSRRHSSPHLSFSRRDSSPSLTRLLLLAGWLVGALLQVGSVHASEPSQATISPDSLRTLISHQRYSEAEGESRSELRTLRSGTEAYAEVLDLLVEASWRQITAQPADAESLARAAVDLRTVQHGDSSRAVADALTALGRTQRNAAHWDEARASLERAITVRERNDGPSSLKLADDLNALASVVKQTNERERAIPLQERSLAIRTQLLPPGHRDIARGQENLALAYSAAYRWGDARRLHEAAVRSFEATAPPDSQGFGQCLINFTSLLLKLRDAQSAYTMAVRARDLNSRVLPPEQPLWVNCVENVANAEQLLGRFVDAVSHSKEAISILDSQGRDDSNTRGRLLLNLGDQWLGVGAADSALASYRSAAESYRKRTGDRPLVAEAWWRQGKAYYYKGEIAKADTLFQAALNSSEGMVPAEAEAIFGSRHDLAVVRLLSGRFDDALDLDRQAARGGTAAVSINIAALTEEEAFAQTKRYPLNCPIALSALAAHQDSSSVAGVWDVIVKSRALVLDEMATRRRRAASAGDSEYADLMARRAQIARDLSQAVKFGQAGNAPPVGFESMMHRRQEVEAELAARNAAFERDHARASVAFSEVAAALHPGEALIGFVRFSYWDPARVSSAIVNAGRSGRSGLAAADSAVSPRYAAFLTKGGNRTPRFVLLGDAKRIDELAREWRTAQEGQGASRERVEQRLGTALRRAVWDPLSGELSGIKTVLIVPDGELHMVNFAALPTGQGHYLVERGPTFHMLTAERDVPSLLAPANSGRGLLAVGGVDFDRGMAAPGAAHGVNATLPGFAAARGVEDCDKGARKPLVPLPGSFVEAQQVVEHWGHLYPNEQTTLLSGSKATESAVLARASGSRALHLATHGFFAHACSDESSRGGPGEGRYWTDDPLLRSGIALAGANRHDVPTANGDDGVLTAEEIATTDLSSLDWVVLSACESGVGEVTPGEGIYGLRRALAIAGARTTVMSLWKVDDLAAQRWMRHLYEARYEEKIPVAEAVRAASLRLLKEQRAHGRSTSPSTWGAFIATGAWR
jgi:CHAT domain-containing protein/tetratricopeptide (TPR) repeat protein